MRRCKMYNIIRKNNMVEIRPPNKLKIYNIKLKIGIDKQD